MTCFNAIALTPALVLATASASAVTLTPTDIHGGDTNTVSFSDGNLTLTPLLGGAATTFNSAAGRLGADPAGTSNANGFSDPDTTVGNANDETLTFQFASGFGLSGLSWDFARADGPNAESGVFISGFTADPLAVISGPQAGVNTVTYFGGTGTLQIELPLANFANPDNFITFGNLAASDGQTLVLSVSDTTEAGALFPITTVSYDVVPEPSSLGLIGLGGLLIARRRRG
ncbi:MAG: PEP-CTERM sorting domain-containing protein [Phycisphaeraceae bacterium]|nr:PEP-CTERM sorting domain-containing protein [Phycisphaeraceae bacterium]